MSTTTMSNANFITQVTALADCVGQTPLVRLQRLPEQEQITNGATLLPNLKVTIQLAQSKTVLLLI